MALTRDRNTPERDGRIFVHPVAAAVKIHAGALVALSATGYATPGATAVGLKGLGRAEESVDNAAGAAGAVSVRVKRGLFRFANAGDAVRADIGGQAYAVDDQTVAADDGVGTRSAIGIIEDLDASGVWVRI